MSAKVSDLQLSQFLFLKQKIKEYTKELEAIQSQIKTAGGNFETDQFLVTTSQYETNRVVDCETLLERVGIVKCTELRLINTTTASRLNVERKEKDQKAA